MTYYATLADAKDEQLATTTTDNAKLLQIIRQVSARVDGVFKVRRPLFQPYIENRQWPLEREHINSWDNTFWFSVPLLALTSVQVGDDVLTVGSTVDVWPSLLSPARYLRIDDCCQTWYDYCTSDCAPPLVNMGGIWGFHRDYSNGWLSVTTLAAAPNASVASITVTDVDGTDAYGRTPWISAGALLRIDTEYLEVSVTDIAANTATVRRGVNGSTAAAHNNGTAVEVWQTEDVIRRAVARQSAFMYARRGAYESTSISDAGIVNFPSDLLAEFRASLGAYAYE